MNAFKNKGIGFSSNIIEDGPVKIAFFNDLDKNPFYLCEVMKIKNSTDVCSFRRKNCTHREC